MARPYLPENLSEADRMRLILTIRQELIARGQNPDPPPPDVSPWHTTPYYPRADGRRFLPNCLQQEEFIRSNARFSALIGGRGSGKTGAGVQRALIKVEQGQSGAIFAPDFEHFRTSTWLEVRQWIPWHKVSVADRGYRYTTWEPRGSFQIVFINGASIIFKGLRDPDSARGPNLNWLWYDEGGRDRTGMGWFIAIAGVRIGPNPSAWVTTTPKGKIHWLYKMFVEQQLPADVKELIEKTNDGRPLIDWRKISIDDNRANLDPGFYVSMKMAYAAQNWLSQQELEGEFVDPGAGLAERVWFQITRSVPHPLDCERVVRYWDMAATEKEQAKADPDWTVGTLTGRKERRYYILDQIAKQYRWSDIKKLIVQTAHIDGQSIPIRLEQEPGAGGKNIIAEIVSLPELAGFDVRGDRPEGDKVVRANPWFSQAAAGNVFLLEADWNAALLNEIEGFPEGDHDDRVDSVSGAMAFLGGMVSMADVQLMSNESARSRWEVASAKGQPRDVQKPGSGQPDQPPTKSRWRVGG